MGIPNSISTEAVARTLTEAEGLPWGELGEPERSYWLERASAFVDRYIFHENAVELEDEITAPETPASRETDARIDAVQAAARSDAKALAAAAERMLSKAADPRYATTDGQPARPGHEDGAAPAPVGPDGQHAAYWVLSPAERAKGFVRPVRRSYKHVGILGPRFPLRDMTEAEQAHFGGGYAKIELYPESELPAVGRGWKQADLDRVGKGCGGVTTMGQAIAETYARDPHFYSATMCVRCGNHFPVGKDGEFVWVDGALEPPERVGT
jgi:hypothetical protein